MILEYKNNQGYIYAYISWNIIDAQNRLTSDGQIAAISGLWIHPEHRHKGILKQMMNDMFVHPTTQQCLYTLHYREGRGKSNKLTPAYRYLKYIGGKDGQRKANKPARNYS
jgi:hypothetical protein